MAQGAPRRPRRDGGAPDPLTQLCVAIAQRRRAGVDSASARLLARGTDKVAQKFGEEAMACVGAAVRGEGAALIRECAGVLFHLAVVLVDARLAPEQVWDALRHRDAADLEANTGPN